VIGQGGDKALTRRRRLWSFEVEHHFVPQTGEGNASLGLLVVAEQAGLRLCQCH